MVRIESKPKAIEDTPEFKRLQKLKEKKLKRLDDSDYPPRDFRPRRKRSRRITCCVFYLIIFLVLCIFALAVVAKVGIFEIPVFSKIFYKIPEPSRLVLSSGANQDNFLESFLVKPGSKDITFEITESELTTLLKTPAEQSQDLTIEELQAAIMSDRIEIFGHLKSPLDAYLTLEIFPQVDEGLLDFTVIGIKIGNLPLPASLANWLINKLLTEPIEQFNQTIKQVGTIESIELQEKKIKIQAQLK